MAGPAYQWGDWRFEPSECRLLRDGVVVPLPAKTLDLLATLLRRAPRLVTKEEILAAVWRDAAVEEGNIAFHVAALRKVLDDSDGTSPIETVRGRGYRFVTDVAIAQMPPTDIIQQAVTEPFAASSPPLADAALPAPGNNRRITIAVMALLIAAAGVVAGNRWLRAAPTAVVVLPFASEADPNHDRYMNTALSYVVAKLELQGFRVAPFTAGPPGEQLREMGARLDVDTVLRGSLRELAGGWRVSIQAVRVSDGRQIWNWAFDEVNPHFKPLEAPDDERAELLGLLATRIAGGLRQHLADRPN